MENYRDEALKAKATAEEKFAENDIVGATRFAVMAYGLFPKLDGILQLLVTLTVHLAAQQKVCGEKDLYGILGSSSSAEVQKLRKQYIEMAVQLHPNQNRAVGAEGAFKLITEAWDTLSDATKKMAYDQRIKGENISLFAGLVKSSEMEKISEVSNDFSECRVSAQHNLFGGESSQGDIQNTCVEKKAADNKFEACSSTLGAKTDGKEEFKGL